MGDALDMASFYKKFPVAEKNLLKIFCSNKYISLQVVNNKTGHIFLWASTLEKELRETLRVTWDKQAARACAGLLARRARAAEQQQITWERHNSFRGQHNKEGRKLPIVGKVKVVIDTLLDHGIEFVQHANKRPPRNPRHETHGTTQTWLSQSAGLSAMTLASLCL